MTNFKTLFSFSSKLNNVKIFFVIATVILFSGSISVADAAFVGSPNYQLESGVAPEDVECRDNLILVLRNNGNSVCVIESTAEKLGWAIVSYDDLIFENSFPVKVVTKQIQNQTKIIPIEYNIKNGNITNIADNGKCSLLLDLDSWDDGNLQIKIPREIIDSKKLSPDINPGDGGFIVLFDGEEAYVLEIKTTPTHRTLDINLTTNNVKVIEIVAFPQWEGTC